MQSGRLTDGSENGRCKLYKKSLQPKLSTFADHEKSVQHMGRVASINQVNKPEQFLRGLVLTTV